MRRTVRMAWTAVAAALLCGCASGPLLDNPMPLPIGGQPDKPVENPVYVPEGPQAYGAVFEKCIDVVDDYFPIAVENRYDGLIRTFPMISPGLEQPWRPGSPDLYQRRKRRCRPSATGPKSGSARPMTAVTLLK